MTARARVRVGLVVTAVAALIAGVGCGSSRTTPAPETASREPTAVEAPAGVPASLGLRVVATIPHAGQLFTQGLVFDADGRLYESAGRYGQSVVRELDPVDGTELRRVELPAEVFAEGLAVDRNGLVQLTWKEGRAFRWESDLSAGGQWTYQGEGWGLTFDPSRRAFLRSDGSADVIVHDAATFAEIDRVAVSRGGVPVPQLNELELVGDDLYANVWRTKEIVRIDPRSGRVTAVIDASAIDPGVPDPESVLNGIAHRPGDPPTRLWLTGKNWPDVYVVDLVAR